MIGIYAALLISFLLLVLLLSVWRGKAQAAQQLPSNFELTPGEEGGEPEACPPEIVSRIFSGDDWHFVEGVRSPLVKKLFRRERKAVALIWVQETSAGIRRVMREHLESARRSQDLEIASEAKIFLLYAQLQFACGVLFACVELAGPQRLRGLAIYTDALARRIAGARLTLRAAGAHHEIHRADSP
jgi:hypothetical protein